MRKLLSALFVLLAVGVAAGGAAGKPGPKQKATCTGGTIARGTYQTLRVTGTCSVDTGTVIVRNNVKIERNAALIAITEGTTVEVFGNVDVGRNAALVLGCNQDVGCATTTSDFVRGNIEGHKSLALILHANTIGGSVSLNGGGGGPNCDPNATLLGSPAYSTFENNQIGGNLSISHYTSCWLGVFRNQVGGNVSLHHNRFADPDADEVTDNVITHNLDCRHNSPPAQIGDSGGGPNTVGGHKRGECADL